MRLVYPQDFRTVMHHLSEVPELQQWLNKNLQQYQLLVDLLTGLLDRGFYPVPTDPTGHQNFRMDHTLAIIDTLNRFPYREPNGPLKVFSTGPVYKPTSSQWTETVDVEILGGTPAESLALVDDLLLWLCRGATRPHLVVGNLASLHRALDAAGLTDLEITTVMSHLRNGNRVDAEALLANRVPASHRIFHTVAWSHFKSADAFDLPPEYYNWLEKLTHLSDVSWDLASVGTWPYYDGLVFSLYGPNIGQPLIRGGQFRLALGGRSWQGIGFTVFVGAYEQFVQGVS